MSSSYSHPELCNALHSETSEKSILILLNRYCLNSFMFNSCAQSTCGINFCGSQKIHIWHQKFLIRTPKFLGERHRKFPFYLIFCSQFLQLWHQNSRIGTKKTTSNCTKEKRYITRLINYIRAPLGHPFAGRFFGTLAELWQRFSRSFAEVSQYFGRSLAIRQKF